MSAKKTCTIQIRCKILLAASHHMPNNICLWENYDPKICLFGQNYLFPCLQYLVWILRNLLIHYFPSLLALPLLAIKHLGSSQKQLSWEESGTTFGLCWYLPEKRESEARPGQPHQLSGAVGCRHSARLHLHIVGVFAVMCWLAPTMNIQNR